MRAHRTNIKQRQSPTSGATLPRPVHVYLLRYTAKEYILRNAGSKLRENPFHEANLYISDDVENKMQILFFFKKRIQLETMRNNGKLNWGAPLELAHGSSDSRGVAILFRKGFDCKIIKKVIDPNGRYISIEVQINDEKDFLMNVYGPNNDNQAVQSYDHLIDVLREEGLAYEDKIIIV